MEEESFNFSELIDDYLKREDKPFPIGEYHPHETGVCLRRTYYKRLIPKKLPPEKLRLFKSGDLTHEFAREVLRKSNRVQLIEWEKPFSLQYPNFKILGRFDDLIAVKLAGEKLPIMVEVKSISGKTVEHIRCPRRSHLYQIHPYMTARGTLLGMIWYIARDTFADRWFSVFYDQNIMNETLVRITLLHDCLTNNKLPPPEARHSKDIRFLCWYRDSTGKAHKCPWWWECKQDFNPQV